MAFRKSKRPSTEEIGGHEAFIHCPTLFLEASDIMAKTLGKKRVLKPLANVPAAPILRIDPGRNGKPTADDIRMRAYEKWEAAGCPTGDGVQFWLQAERELLQSN